MALTVPVGNFVAPEAVGRAGRKYLCSTKLNRLISVTKVNLVAFVSKKYKEHLDCDTILAMLPNVATYAAVWVVCSPSSYKVIPSLSSPEEPSAQLVGVAAVCKCLQLSSDGHRH